MCTCVYTRIENVDIKLSTYIQRGESTEYGCIAYIGYILIGQMYEKHFSGTLFAANIQYLMVEC